MNRSRTRSLVWLCVGLVALYACGGSEASRHVVVVDPGHPSETSEGTRGPSGLTENHVNWVIGQKVRALLEERGYEVIMTKLVEDELVTNRHRADIANYNSADLMVRLHCDAGDHSGTATFYPDRQGTRFEVTGPSDDVIAGSEALARAFHPAMIEVLGSGWNDLGIKGDSKTAVGSRQGALTGSIFSQVPVITVEMVVLTNPDDEAFIAEESGQDRMARAIAAGIDAYFRTR
ncbi:MAG: N-acetylmuramoyl-L-alanine amidase [Gemmatimonadales bacterium]|jgi:N-acetylmuramoyl-L-alanine amidase